MKTENKQSWMIWAIAALVVLNISTLATILFHQYQSNKTVVSTEQMQNQPGADAEKFSGRYFRDKLNLDGTQMEKFREINPAFRLQARDVTMELAAKRKQMLVEMASAHADTNKLNALSDSIGILHARLKKLTYKYYLDLKGICNADQQKQLEQLFNEMFINDAPMGFPGRGGMGWQHGKRMNN